MPTLITHFELDVETGKKILTKFQFLIFKIKGMQIINHLERQMRKAGTETKKELHGFSAMAEGSEESCKEGHDRIMKMLTDTGFEDPEIKKLLNSRDMKGLKKLFLKGSKKIMMQGNSPLMVLNSMGIISDVKII